MIFPVRFFSIYFSPDYQLYQSLKNILGFYPRDIALYKQAFTHRSISTINEGIKDSNERLEYLGDAVLGLVISDFLFQTFPHKDEGFLTKMRSRIVSRHSLNQLGIKFGLSLLIQKSGNTHINGSSIVGNAFEALIGAVFLDRGYLKTQQFILTKIVNSNIDLEELETKEVDFKTKLIEWGQKEKKKIMFNLVKEVGRGSAKKFVVEVFIDEVAYAETMHYSKKRAEQIVAEQACVKLQLM